MARATGRMDLQARDVQEVLRRATCTRPLAAPGRSKVKMRIMQRILVRVSFVAAIAASLLATIAARQPAPQPANHVVIITLDGFGGWALEDPDLPLPTLRQLAAGGAVARGMRPVNPTVT